MGRIWLVLRANCAAPTQVLLLPVRVTVMRITSKGQVTIPMDIREQLGLLPDTEVEFAIDRDAVRITKVRRPTARSRARGIVESLRGRATTGLTTEQIMRMTRK